MYSYNIAKEADDAAFKKACESIEANLKGIEKEDILVDVDGTMIQIYNTPDGRIKVINDYEVDAVYVDSDVELSNVL